MEIIVAVNCFTGYFVILDFLGKLLPFSQLKFDIVKTTTHYFVNGVPLLSFITVLGKLILHFIHYGSKNITKKTKFTLKKKKKEKKSYFPFI